MSFTVQQKRSSEENRRPNPSSLEDGQVAINYNNDSPGAFFKTTTGSLSKVGSCTVSQTAPAPVNWTELSVGEMWLDTTNNRLKVWNGTSWITVVG